MSCVWPQCDRPGDVVNVQFPDSCHVLSICVEHFQLLRAQLLQAWQPISDAGDLDTTIALILLDQSHDITLADRPGLRALGLTIRRRNWRQLRGLGRAFFKASSTRLWATAAGVLIGVIGILLLAALGRGLEWVQANPDIATNVAVGVVALLVLGFLFKLIRRLTRKWGRPVPYMLVIVAALAIGSWLAALVVTGICIHLEIAISLRRLVKLAEDRQRHQT